MEKTRESIGRLIEFFVLTVILVWMVFFFFPWMIKRIVPFAPGTYSKFKEAENKEDYCLEKFSDYQISGVPAYCYKILLNFYENK